MAGSGAIEHYDGDDYSSPSQHIRRKRAAIAVGERQWTAIHIQGFAEFMLANGIDHQMGAPYHPETNGLAERLVQTVKKSLKRMEGEPGDFMTKINRFLLGYRNTPHSATGQTPAILLNNRPLRSRLDLLLPPKEKGESTGKKAVPRSSRLVKTFCQEISAGRALGRKE